MAYWVAQLMKAYNIPLALVVNIDQKVFISSQQ
jgi:hypothetical protein